MVVLNYESVVLMLGVKYIYAMFVDKLGFVSCVF
jgi:hypothetical protein